MSVTSKTKQLAKLKRKPYRDAYVAEHVKTSLPFQIRALREQRDWSQGELGDKTGMRQNAISRLEKPDYGSLTVNTLLRLASAFDVALLIKFVPFRKLLAEFSDLSKEALEVSSFDQELPELEQITTSTAWHQGRFAYATIEPKFSFGTDVTDQTEDYYEHLREKMGLSSVSLNVSPTLRALTIGPVGFDKPIALGERLKGTVLSLDYSYWIKEWVKETSDEKPEIDYTEEVDPISIQSTVAETYKGFSPSIFLRGGSTQHVN